MAVKILTDSACDLPNDIIEKYDIDVMPLMVIDNDKEYEDNVTIKPESLYDNMRDGRVYKTSQVPQKTFEDEFKDIAKKKECAIYVAFSSGLSATHQASVIVKDSVKDQYPDLDITIVDTKSASLGFGLFVYKAAKMAKEGKSKEEILNMLEFYINNIEHIFTVDDIEYLFRGGRVNRAQAFVGGLLSIKPILHVTDEGKLQPLEKIRGKNKVLKRMLEIMDERTQKVDLKEQTIGISHGDDLDKAMKLKEMIEEKYGCTDFVINNVGCVIGAHSGPGTLALFFLNEKYED